MTGLDSWIVALAYVPGATELKPIRVRKPSRRAKSTVCAVESTLTLEDPLFRVMLFKVTLKASTDGSGASSPVTNTADCWLFCVAVTDDEEPELPQATANASRPNKAETASNRFIGRNSPKDQSRGWVRHVEKNPPWRRKFHD